MANKENLGVRLIECARSAFESIETVSIVNLCANAEDNCRTDSDWIRPLVIMALNPVSTGSHSWKRFKKKNQNLRLYSRDIYRFILHFIWFFCLMGNKCNIFRFMMLRRWGRNARFFLYSQSNGDWRGISIWKSCEKLKSIWVPLCSLYDENWK